MHESAGNRAPPVSPYRIENASQDFCRQLLEDGVISSSGKLIPMTGGVSSDIYRVEDPNRDPPLFVVKRALAKLRVEADWRADIRRNRFEVAYLDEVGKIVPENVPRVLSRSEGGGYFTMELLGPEFRNWKTTLLGGECDPRQAIIAGNVLGRIHRETWGNGRLRSEFDTTDIFFDLRLESYLLATAEKHRDLAARIEAEAGRIRTSRQCLVHGDFSPKNLLFKGEAMKILDCEVAWYGDAAFDISFLLNHLAIKALHLRENRMTCLEMLQSAWNAYHDELREEEVEIAAAGLLPMLMLARVDGKSPLEYLEAKERDAIREFTPGTIADPCKTLAEFFRKWSGFLDSHSET